MQVFRRVNESHNHRTRHSVNSVILPQVGPFGKKAFYFIGAKIWNQLPNDIRILESKQAFKAKCKEHFMSALASAESEIYHFY